MYVDYKRPCEGELKVKNSCSNSMPKISFAKLQRLEELGFSWQKKLDIIFMLESEFEMTFKINTGYFNITSK